MKEMRGRDRHASARKHGFVFIIALMSMLAMVLVGTAFIGSAVQQFNDARRDLDMLQAVAMADAGMNYFIWNQRYSDHLITTVHDTFPTDIHTLSPEGTPAPQIQPSTVAFGEGQAAVWLFSYMPVGASLPSYQIISKGYYRGRERIVRAVLQGPVTSSGGLPPKWLDYTIFADSAMIVSSSTDVNGDIASNENITLNTSGGSDFTGNVRAASWVKLVKNSTYIDGSLLYGTTVYDDKNKQLTNSEASSSFSSGAVKIPDDQPKKIELDGMNPQAYYNWANQYGVLAFYDSTSLSNASLVTTPILYVNQDKLPNFTLDISCNLLGPVTIFVNGNVQVSGNTAIGSSSQPVALIATGNISCSGNPTIHGMAWAQGTFGNGTPYFFGSIRCGVLGNFQGNPQLHWHTFDDDIITPPNFDGMWTMGSWELL